MGAPACGDVMKLQIKVGEDGKIQEAVFKTFGCGSAIASSSLATEWVKGMDIEEAIKIKNTEIAKHLSLPPVKLHCSMLAEDAIKAAVKYDICIYKTSLSPAKFSCTQQVHIIMIIIYCCIYTNGTSLIMWCFTLASDLKDVDSFSHTNAHCHRDYKAKKEARAAAA